MILAGWTLESICRPVRSPVSGGRPT